MAKHILGRVQITRKCNQECVFCSNPPQEKEMSPNEVREEIKRLKIMGTTDLMFTGGEPTLNSHLIEILKFASDLDFNEITIQTNGTRLDDMNFVNKLGKFKELRFNVSFHTSDERAFDKISNRPGNLRRLLNGLDNVRDARIPVFLTVVINELNYRKLKEHVKFIKKRYPNITHISFNFIDPICNAEKNSWTIPKLSDAESHIHDAVNYMKDNDITFRIERIPLCYMRGFEESSSDIRRDVLDEYRIMRFLRTEHDSEQNELDVERRTMFDYAPVCDICSLKGLCPGLNPHYARIHGNGELYPVFDRPEDIAKKVKASRNVSSVTEYMDMESVISQDLELFENAIRIKSSKNNIYDTYSFFMMNPLGERDDDFILGKWKGYVERIRDGSAHNLLSMYVHIPFCKSNCSYCVYASTVPESRNNIDEYISLLSSQMKRFGPVFGGLKFKTLYIGGGTPSMLSEKQLERLVRNLYSAFDFEQGAEKAIEFNPSTTTMGKLEVLRKYGFNKLSFGIQSLSERVLKANNRGYQTNKIVQDAISMARKAGLEYINVDLMMGLKSDTAEDFLMSLRGIFEMNPDNICIYPIKTNRAYIRRNYGSIAEFERFYYSLYNQVVEGMKNIGKEYGFEKRFNLERLSYIAPFIFSRKNQGKGNTKYSYSQFRKEPFSNFCLGYYSHSIINKDIDYRYVDRNNTNSMFLKRFSLNPDDYIYSVNEVAPMLENVKFIVLEFYKKRKVSRTRYKKLFGSDIRDDFPYAVNALERLGVLRVMKNWLEFRDMDEREAYKYMLFFVGRNIVRRRVGL